MQREDLSPIEWIEAIAEMVDAELIEDTDYAALAETAPMRVRTQLMKLQSDETHGTAHVSKFTNERVARLFAGLPRPVTWQSYLTNDLPLLNLPEPVKALAITEKLSKSKAEALGEMQRKAPRKLRQLMAQGGVMALEDLVDWTAKRDEIRPLSEVSVASLSWKRTFTAKI